MKRAGNDTQVIANLLKNNDPPSDDQRVVLSTRLRALEAEFQLIVGKAFSSELKESQLPRAAKGPHKAIQLRRTLLCGVRSLPDELLQTVFEFVVFNEDGNHSSLSLRRLCSVSRRWRQAATRHCILWTKPAPINLRSTRHYRIRKTANRLKLYLSRSGNLPISFKLWLYHPVWETTKEFIQEPVQLLMDQSHRWDVVELRTPLAFYEHLSPIRGKIPKLRELEIDTDWRSDNDPTDKKLSIECFAEAPSLRKVTYDTRYAFRTSWAEPDTVLQFSLPWSQLHEFNASAQCDTSYHDIIQAEPLELRQLEYFASTTNSLYDSNPLTLPALTKLIFRTYELNSELDILAHLDLLTLPALTHLEIRGLSSPTMNRLYDRVLSLVTRSKCSLQCLCIHASEGFTSGQWTPCSKLLALCPELTHLLLASPEGDLLNTLIYDPSSPCPMLPKLKVFIVRNSDIDGVSRVLDASALMKVIKSRTEGLPEGTQQALEEVTFIWDDAEMLQLQISFMELADMQSEESSAFNIARTATEELASRARLRLDSQFNRWWHRRRAYFNPKLHLEMNNFLSQLEDLDLEKHDTRPFMVCLELSTAHYEPEIDLS